MEEISLKVRKILVTHFWHAEDKESDVLIYRNYRVINQEIQLFTNPTNVQLCCRGLEPSYHWVIVFDKSNDIIVYENGHLKGRTTWESFDEAMRNLSQVENFERWECCDPMCFDFLLRVFVDCLCNALHHSL